MGPPRWRDRLARGMLRWAQRHAERRIREEWAAYRGSGELKTRWFRRDPTTPRTQNFRSLVQVNFYRAPRS
jgi:hypothetical protein